MDWTTMDTRNGGCVSNDVCDRKDDIVWAGFRITSGTVPWPWESGQSFCSAWPPNAELQHATELAEVKAIRSGHLVPWRGWAME